MLNALLQLSLTDVIDIGMVGLLFWALITWTRRVHASLALLGLAVLGGFYLLALQLELQLTVWIFQGFFAVLVIILVVVFQDDLRRLFEQIAVRSLRRRPARPDTSGVAAIYRAMVQLARARIGALLVVPGREPLERHLQGGIELDAAVSEELLMSIFDPHSVGHDGAILVQGNRLARFAVHLPLSEDHEQLGSRGTRHAAALGLTERSDALCVVVSEERGTISVASQGQLRTLAETGQLLNALYQHLEHQQTKTGRDKAGRPRLRRRLLEGSLAFTLALASWLAFVPGSTVGQITREVPVIVENIPEGFILEQIEPELVQVQMTGPRRRLLLAQAADFQAIIDARPIKLGRRTFVVTREMIRHSTDLEVLTVTPEKVRLSVREAKSTPPGR
jgi:diadenylate cyclase